MKLRFRTEINNVKDEFVPWPSIEEVKAKRAHLLHRSQSPQLRSQEPFRGRSQSPIKIKPKERTGSPVSFLHKQFLIFNWGCFRTKPALQFIHVDSEFLYHQQENSRLKLFARMLIVRPLQIVHATLSNNVLFPDQRLVWPHLELRNLQLRLQLQLPHEHNSTTKKNLHAVQSRSDHTKLAFLLWISLYLNMWNKAFHSNKQ
jgi:hypothetical protein